MRGCGWLCPALRHSGRCMDSTNKACCATRLPLAWGSAGAAGQLSYQPSGDLGCTPVSLDVPSPDPAAQVRGKAGPKNLSAQLSCPRLEAAPRFQGREAAGCTKQLGADTRPGLLQLHGGKGGSQGRSGEHQTSACVRASPAIEPSSGTACPHVSWRAAVPGTAAWDGVGAALGLTQALPMPCSGVLHHVQPAPGCPVFLEGHV